MSNSKEGLLDRYRFGRRIGQGQYGCVRLVLDSITNAHHVCKTVGKTTSMLQEEAGELRILSEEGEVIAMLISQGHKHIVKLLDSFEDDDFIHIIMELCRGGDMLDFISNMDHLTEELAAHLIFQMASALDHCHSRGLVHSDIKPENILISGYSLSEASGALIPILKLSDFGTSFFIKKNVEVRGLAGSLKYMSPEMVKGIPYSKEIDIWSLGIVLYVSLTGDFPFNGRDREDVITSICSKKLKFKGKKWSKVSQEAIDLVCWMLERDPTKRATAKDVLNHGWVIRLTKHNKGKVGNFEESQDVILKAMGENLQSNNCSLDLIEPKLQIKATLMPSEEKKSKDKKIGLLKKLPSFFKQK